MGVRDGKRHDRENYRMRVVSFYTTYYNGSDIKNDEMVVTYRAYGGDEKYAQNFSGQLTGKSDFGRPIRSVNGRVAGK